MATSETLPTKTKKQKKPKVKKVQTPAGQMTFFEHLAELRTRIVVCAIAVVITTSISFYFSRDLVQLFLDLGKGANVPGKPPIEFVITSIIGNFTIYFNVALITGLLLASPMIVYHLLAFLAPALEPESQPGEVGYDAELKLLNSIKRSLWFFIPGLVFSFAIGVVFAYYLVLPPSLRFLLNFTEGQFTALPTGENLVSICTKVMFWTGLIFELPLIMFLVARLQIVNWKRMAKFWKVALVLSLVVAAFVNPSPDVATQFIFSIPIYGLYWLGVLLARFA